MTHRIVIDAESPFGKGFSLTTMSPPLYIRDPRFKLFGMGIKLDDAPAEWISGPDMMERLHALPWEDSRVVAHNLTGFDGLVLTEVVKRKAKTWADTLGMARAWLPTGASYGLDWVANHLHLGGKIEGVLESLRDVYEPTQEQLDALGVYCVQDVELCAQIDDRLWPLMSESERYIMHLTCRMGVEPVLELDVGLLEQELKHAKASRAQKLEAGGLPLKVLSSNQQFFAHLTTLIPDEDLPRKKNAKGETIPALGKADSQWVKCKAKYPELSALFEARENSKSNIHATRAQTYLDIAKTDAGTLPALYAYYGAGTGRLSSVGKLGIMNLPSTRISQLRTAIKAPPGHVLHVADSEQIELRVRLWLCDELNTLKDMANGYDLYKHAAAAIYDKPVEEITKAERQVGKVSVLALQFGMGWKRYQAYLSTGPMGMPPLRLTDTEAQTSVNRFRKANKSLVDVWGTMGDLLSIMANENYVGFYPWKGCEFYSRHVVLPNDAVMDYSGLLWNQESEGYQYGAFGTTKFIHPAQMLENLCQSLARIVVLDQIAEVDRTIARCVMTTHDEGVFVAPETDAQARQATIERTMSIAPDWAPGLLVGASGAFDTCYSK